MPPALSAKDLPGGQSQILNVSQIGKINSQLVNSREYSTVDNISNTEHWQNWNCDWNNANDREDNSAADDKSHIQQNNGI